MEIKKPIFEKWEEFIQKFQKRAPDGMKGMFQSSEDVSDMTTEIGLHNIAKKILIV